MAQVYVYARLQVSLGASASLALFEEADHGIEALSDLLSTVIRESTLAAVFEDSAIIDLIELTTQTSQPEILDEVVKEFRHLLKTVREIELEVRDRFFPGETIHHLHLHLPNILVLEYRTHERS